MQRRLLSVWLVGGGLLLGVFGMMLFYGRLIGFSFPVFIVALVGMVVVFNKSQPSARRNLWLVVPLVFFALMIAVRADWTVIQLNIAAVLVLGALLLFYLRTGQPADTASLSQHVTGAITTGVLILPMAATEVKSARQWSAEKMPENRSPLLAIGRGVLFALPVLLVFGVLLGSADAVFGQHVNNLLNSFRYFNLGEIFGRTVTTLGLGWLSIGVLAHSVIEAAPARVPSTDNVDDEVSEVLNAVPKKKPFVKLSIIESSIVLGSVNLMFAAFVLIQFTYFFGGQISEGSSYAEYARRGFFELVAVSILTLGMVLALDRVTLRQGIRENRIFRALAVIMVCLTGVMLISAWKRMSLYEDAFGFTHLRIYTRVFMVWLGVLFGFFLLSLFRLRLHIFSLGVLIALIGFLGTLNLFNIDHYIAENNINRYHAGYDLDVRFLAYLSTDALPPIIALYETTDNPELRADLGQILARQYNELRYMRDRMNGTTIFSTNLARDGAWGTLSQLELPSYDYSYPLWRYNAYNYSRDE